MCPLAGSGNSAWTFTAWLAKVRRNRSPRGPLRGAEGAPPGNTAVGAPDAASTSETTGKGRVGAIKPRANDAAMARNPSDAYEYAAGEVTPPPVLFANPIGEDYFVRGFNGDSSYQWDDEWDDDAPSDEIDAVYWKSTH